MEFSCSYSRHLGPRYEGAGLRIQINDRPPNEVRFRNEPPAEYREAILRGIYDGLIKCYSGAARNVVITEVMDHPVDSNQRAFYLVARLIIEQAHSWELMIEDDRKAGEAARSKTIDHKS